MSSRRLTVSINLPERLFMITPERDDLNDHLNSDTFSVLPGTRSLLLKPIEIHVQNVSDIEGIEAIYEAVK